MWVIHGILPGLEDDNLYSPFTDGGCPRLDGSRDDSNSNGDNATTGQGVIEGDDPLNLKIYSPWFVFSSTPAL